MKIFTSDLIKESYVVNVDLRVIDDGGYYAVKKAELPIDKGTLSVLAKSLLAGRPFTEREWAGRGRPLSCRQVRQLRKMFRWLGILELVNPFEPRQGYRLTRAGKAFMKYFSESPALPRK